MASCELIFLKRGARGRPRLQWLGRCCFLMVACPCMACVVALPLAAAAPATAVAVAAPDSELDREPTWSPPTPAAVRQRMFDWIAASGSATEAATAARGLWPEAAAAREDAGQTGVDDLLDRVMTTFALLDPRCAALQADLAANRGWLGDAGTTDFQRESVKLWLGREFVRQDRFDDGLAVLADLDVATAVDPAALLFNRAACQHWLLEADAAVESLDRLLERAGGIPVRYERLARLMRADIAALDNVRTGIKKLQAEADVGAELEGSSLDAKLKKIKSATATTTARAQLDELKRQAAARQGAAATEGVKKTM